MYLLQTLKFFAIMNKTNGRQMRSNSRNEVEESMLKEELINSKLKRNSYSNSL
jgi:hypothetical protein